MRRALLLPLVLAALASGCGGEASSAGDFAGEQKRIADLVEQLETASESGDAKEICDEVLAESLRDGIAETGSSCEEELDKAISDADDYNLDVEEVTIDGDQAVARVKGRVGDSDRVSEIRFTREGADWRATSLG